MSMTSPSRRRTEGDRSWRKERRHVAGGSRRRSVDRRMDLDAGRHADHGHAQADGVADGARRAVAAGEKDQVDAGGQQVARGLLGVGRRRVHELAGRAQGGHVVAVPALDLGPGRTAAERAQHARVEAGRAGLVLAHLGRPRDDLDVVAHPRQALQRQPCPPRCVAHGAQRERQPQDLRAVAPLEAHPAADAGDGVDDQPEPLHFRFRIFFLYARQVKAHCSGSSMASVRRSWSIGWACGASSTNCGSA